MNEIKKTNFSLRTFLLKTLLDPVLWYTVLIMSALMFHYRDRVKDDTDGYFFSACWGIATYIIGWLMFRVFDYMQKHHIIGFGIYAALVAVFGFGIRVSINNGIENYPISWMLWFLTPQDSVEYNKWYTIGFFLLFLLFMASVIYYFTHVRYRIFMNFLIFIIPFAIYGKEYEKMPTLFIIFLAVGYILLMVYYRQLKDDETTEFVHRKRSWKVIAAYAMAFASIAAIFPKPKVNADRTYIETLINAEQLTDKLVDILNVFRDTSSGQQFRSNQNWAVYDAVSDGPLRIKTKTFSSYDYEKDEWKAKESDNYFYDRTEAYSAPMNISPVMGMADVFLEAARLDSGYAEEFGLTEYAEKGLDTPEIKHVKFYSMSGVVGYASGAETAPVPQFAIKMTDCSRKGLMFRYHSGVISAAKDVDEKIRMDTFATTERFEFDYSDDSFFDSPTNRSFIEQINKADYDKLLERTEEVLNANYKDGLAESDENFNAICDYFFEQNYLYNNVESFFLDYGNNARIKELADKITAGCETEYEKALKLEQYFYNNDYKYDLGYRKKKGENAENFIFDTKTGVCYEYATSMVLLARAAGIPARYCEGYNMTKKSNELTFKDANYYVTSQDAHGFPELYIKGYGWISFEPTITDEVIETKKGSATEMLSKAGLVILLIGLLAVLFLFVYPWLSHKIFVLRSKKRSPKELVMAVMHRICKVYDIENVNTSHEVCGLVHEASGADIEETARLFDRTVYGEKPIGEYEKQRALEEYIRAYEAFRESRKRKGITNR
ncbi:MAG: transglutaminase-like domain-containing protein [Ruminococcus sp.]|uniref:transglutaminase-like domain-containing protein n=1 Tax=Ruminococcus sp. TaxID=41978 RepID=UPI0025D1CF79|nr:transglutaminase-like domain-containing protein [Ruminococcus sp.]MCR4794309.1 transglutaminase-like domain-containing protein [Ruminococcus sp.]